MTERLFRGKRVDTKEWVYGYLAEPNVINAIIKDDSTGFLTYDAYEVVPETVGQCAGLTDIHGKNIYEGDLISFVNKFIYEVRFEDAKFVCYHTKKDWGRWGDLKRLTDSDFEGYDYEVISNIYDTTEEGIELKVINKPE